MNNTNSKWYLFLVLVLLVGMAYWFGTNNLKKTSLQTEEGAFRGTLVRAEEGALVLRGFFTSPRGLAADIKGQRDFSLKVDSSTKFKKISVSMPSISGKPVDVKDLPREEVAGSISDIRSLGTTTQAMFTVSFFFKDKNLATAVAKEVSYQFFVEPKI